MSGMNKIDNILSFAGGSLFGLLSFVAPLKISFIVIFVVIAADFITGIWASRIRKISVSSRRLRKSIRKMIGYFEVIFLLYIIEKGFDFEIGTYRFTGGFICFIELISILENSAVITENKVFLSLIRLLRGKAKSAYGDMIDEILNEKNND